MIDLTNRTVEDVNALINLYTPVLEVSNIKKIEELYLFVVMLDVAVKHIKEKHNELTIDWKVWCVIVVKKVNKLNKLKYEEEVVKVIDDFVNYWKNEYQNYCNNIAMFVSEFDRDLGFVYQYVNKKNR